MLNNAMNIEKTNYDQKPNSVHMVVRKPNLRLLKTPEDYTDIELVESFVKDGSETAFNEIYNRYYYRVRSLAFKMIYDQDQAEESVQDVFIKLVNNLDTFRGESKFSTWLYSITLNTIRMRLRDINKYKMNLSFDNDNSLEEIASLKMSNNSRENPEDVLMNKEFVQRLDKALELVPPKYRDVFVLSDIEEYTNPEIAEQLGLSIPAVKSRLHRARKYLRTNLSNH